MLGQSWRLEARRGKNDRRARSVSPVGSIVDMTDAGTERSFVLSPSTRRRRRRPQRARTHSRTRRLKPRRGRAHRRSTIDDDADDEANNDSDDYQSFSPLVRPRTESLTFDSDASDSDSSYTSFVDEIRKAELLKPTEFAPPLLSARTKIGTGNWRGPSITARHGPLLMASDESMPFNVPSLSISVQAWCIRTCSHCCEAYD